jgi:hypothetical protein
MKLKTRISRLKSSARHRGIPVRLMDYEYNSLLKMGCMYCGKRLDDENGVCLDRIDSKKGYTLENVTPCCKRCNVAKNDMDIVEFIKWVERTYNFMQDKIKQLQQIEIPYSNKMYYIEKYLHKHNKTDESICIKIE